MTYNDLLPSVVLLGWTVAGTLLWYDLRTMKRDLQKLMVECMTKQECKECRDEVIRVIEKMEQFICSHSHVGVENGRVVQNP